MATVGSGHNAVAEAIIAELRSGGAQMEIECVDVMQYTPRLFRAYYAGGFALAMSRFGRAYGLGFRLTNRPHCRSRGPIERQRLAGERLAMRRFEQYLLAQRPDVVVNTHFLPAPLIGRLIANGVLAARQFVVVTDIESHRRWYSRNVRRWFVPSDYTAGIFRRWGIPDRRITISGIPVHPKWTRPVDRAKVLADWNLPADRKIVLLSGGTEFTCGPIVRIARRMAASCPEAHLIVLAGRDKKLLSSLARLGEAGGRLVPMGFTDRLHELVAICSLMVTKAGGVMTAECLARGTPMVLLKPVPGHEAGNARYLAGRGAAVVTRGVADTAETVRRLLNDSTKLAELAGGARRLHRPAAKIVADAIRRAAGGVKEGGSSCPAGRR